MRRTAARCALASVIGITAIGSAVSAAAAATPASFDAASTFGLNGGARPTAVAVGDLNGDGKLDTVTSNRTSNTVSVLLGDGAGGLGTATSFGLGGATSPIAVAIADLDNDGKLDVVTSNGAHNSVSVLLGDGTGDLGTATTFSLAGGQFPNDIAIGDLDGDGNPDVVTSNGNSDNVSVLLGDGLGGLGTAASHGLSGGDFPQSVAIADLDGDGKLDVTVANLFTNDVSVLLGDGAGGLGSAANFATGSLPVALAVADLDGDGKRDVATANLSGSTSVLLGDGAGGLGSPSAFGLGSGANGPSAIVVGDPNGDTEPDLITANGTSHNVSVLAGDGAGGFGLASVFGLAGPRGPSGIAVGDLNGDGRPDLVTSNETTSNVSVLLNNLVPSCDGHPATIVGTEGNDVLVGTSGDDVIVGLGGNDVIVGLGGNDIICGGAGDDVIDGGSGHDRLFGQAGNDVISGGAGDDVISGGWGDDVISGGNGDDTIDGAAGWDVCAGGSGTDTAVNCEIESSIP
ncbi:MAG: FG-GAP-like repeat-containing protein [Solirubrobacteraceae bacterium]|nr:FG-GAP-like repeat-containing protein [Solirubrobacteraceae bacterium]